MFRFILLSITALFFMSCAQPQGNDRLREKAEIEARSGQDAADNKAREMETRLARQQRFFQGVAGTYTGVLNVEKSKFDVKFVITPTIPMYIGERVRAMDEITYDLTNLALDVEETTSKPGNPPFATGCVYTGLRPKTDSGFILATSRENCALTFVLSLGDAVSAGTGTIREYRESTTRKILDGEINRIDVLEVEMRSIHKPGSETFLVHRIR